MLLCCSNAKLWKIISWNFICHKEMLPCIRNSEIIKKTVLQHLLRKMLFKYSNHHSLSRVGTELILGSLDSLCQFSFGWKDTLFMFCFYLPTNYSIIPLSISSSVCQIILMRNILSYYRKVNRFGSVETEIWIKDACFPGLCSCNTMLRFFMGIYLLSVPIGENSNSWFKK